MSPIKLIDYQRRMTEVGRIRIGQQVATGNNKTRPARLETFRLTSPDRNKIEAAARIYGGTVKRWQAPAGPQWEVITETDRLAIILPPAAMAFTQWLELWSGGGCQRRCDGQTEQLTDGPCLCDPAARECEPHSRLSVLLTELPGIGLWRIDSQGYYAAVELRGAVDLLDMAAGRNEIPATLRLEQRVVKRPGEQTKRFPVPCLDVSITAGELLLGDHGRRQLPPAPYDPEQYDGEDPDEVAAPTPREWARRTGGNMRPIPEDSPQHWPPPTLAQQAGIAPPDPDAPPAAPRRQRSNRALPVPPTGAEPRTREQLAAQQAAPRSRPSADQNAVHTGDTAQTRDHDPNTTSASPVVSGPAAGTPRAKRRPGRPPKRCPTCNAQQGDGTTCPDPWHGPDAIVAIVEAPQRCHGHDPTGSPCTLPAGHDMPCAYENGQRGGWIVRDDEDNDGFVDWAAAEADREAAEILHPTADPGPYGWPDEQQADEDTRPPFDVGRRIEELDAAEAAAIDAAERTAMEAAERIALDRAEAADLEAAEQAAQHEQERQPGPGQLDLLGGQTATVTAHMGDESTALISAGQLKALHTAIGAVYPKLARDRDAGLTWLGTQVGHPVASSRDLTYVEADLILDRLAKEQKQRAD